MTDVAAFLVAALVVALVGIRLGMLIGARLTGFQDRRDDEDQRD